MKKTTVLLVFLSSVLCCPADTLPDAAPVFSAASVAGHEYVNLGLPSGTLWATCNVGASSCSETGNFYAWGEIQPKANTCCWENYAFWLGYHEDDTCGGWQDVESIGEDICGTEYDVVAREWGQGWRMPTEEECRELLRYCVSLQTEENGVPGIRIVGRNEQSIFLPAGGVMSDTGIYESGTMGAYWTGVEKPTILYTGITIPTSIYAAYMGLHLRNMISCQLSDAPKCDGKNIRPVISRKDMVAGIAPLTVGQNDVRVYCENRHLHITDNAFCGRVSLFSSAGSMVFAAEVSGNGCELPPMDEGIYIVTLSKEGKTICTQKLAVK